MWGVCEGVCDSPAPRALPAGPPAGLANRVSQTVAVAVPRCGEDRVPLSVPKGGVSMGESSAQEAVNPTLRVMVSVICALDQAELRHSGGTLHTYSVPNL